MKVWQKEKIRAGKTKITLYRLFGYCILKKEKTPEKSKYNIAGIKITRKTHHVYPELSINELFAHRIENISVDIIIPVYNGYEYLPGLFNGIKENTDIKYRLIVINDYSSDTRVKKFLENIRKKDFENNMLLLNNENNVGFVKTVNKGLKLTKNHVILLNTDVILPKNWASRLLFPILKDKKVASVTPFSNAATIFSLPKIGEDNPFAGDMENINRALEKIIPPYDILHFPTAVGFCMAINKTALDKIGFLDEIFEEGYGEENDWCQRAIKKGFSHTVAANLFVWHKHGGYFNSAKKKKLISKHLKIIKKRYPKYDTDIQTAVNDVNYLLVHFVAEILYFNAAAANTEVWFDHSWKGGTETYTFDCFEKLKKTTLCLRVQDEGNGFVLTYYCQNFNNRFVFKQLEDLLLLLQKLNIAKIVINNLASYKNPLVMLKQASFLKQKTKAVVSFRTHDLQCICPNICMINNNKKYCAVKDLKGCKKCFAEFNGTCAIPVADIDNYQFEYKRFFETVADEIQVFSHSTQNIIERHFPQVKGKITYIPHAVKPLRAVTIPKHQQINIAVLGAIGINKGAEIIEDADNLIKKYPSVTITIIGEIACKHLKNIRIYGKYERDKLPQIMEKLQIDMVLIPSIWPETFSYTTSEAMDMELPLACFNLGAQAEKVKHYKKGVIISKMSANAVLEEILQYFSDK